MDVAPSTETKYAPDELIQRNGKPTILIFYSSLQDQGGEWCPFCTRISAFLKTEIQGGKDGEEGDGWRIVRVGGQLEWKEKSNYYRQDPFNIKGVPTIIKVPGVLPDEDVDAHALIKKAPRCLGADLFNPLKRTQFLEINPWMFL